VYEKILVRHPDAAFLHNGLAWLAAKCNRDLDGALRHATRAVELDPKSAAILDTLAEVQFIRGDKSGAATTIRKAIELDRPTVLADQLKRFASGIQGAMRDQAP